MALDATVMKNLIKSKIEALSDFPGAGETANYIDDRPLEALCEGIIEHFIAEAEITVEDVTSGNETAQGSITS